MPVVISSVGAAPYGVWLFLIAISSYFNYSDLGVGTAIIHFGSRARGGSTRHTMSELASSALLWTSCIGIIVIPGYAAVSWLYVGSVAPAAGVTESDRVVLVAMATAVACGLVIRPFSGVLIGSGNLLLDRKFQFTGVIIRIIGTILACTIWGTLAAVAVAEAAALLTPTLLAAGTVITKRIAIVRFSRRLWPTLKEMMHFSMRAFAVSLSSALIANGGTLVIGLVGSPVQVTYFTAATRVLNGVGQITSWASTPFQSTLSRLYHSSPKRATAMIRNLVFSSFSVSAVACGALIWAAQPAVDFWLGQHASTDEVALTMTLLLCGAIVNSLQRPLLLASEASGKPGIFFRTQFAVAVVFLFLGFLFGPAFGAIGVAFARLIPIVIVSPAYVLMARRHFELSPRDWWRDGVSPALMFLMPAIALAAVVALVVAKYPTMHSGWMPAVAYGGACVLMVALLRSKLPFKELRANLRSPM